MTENPVVQMNNIYQRYGSVEVLHGISLSIERHQVHGLVGENGSGKSTVVKLLSGIVRPSRGQISVNGEQRVLRSPQDAQRLGISTVFQETLVSDNNTCIENILLGSEPLVMRRAERTRLYALAAGFLEQLGIRTSILDAKIASLSLADRQALSIVRGLVKPWKLLILDEATSALDSQARDKLFEMVRDFTKEGRAVLFVSHRMDELLSIVDTVTVQRSGSTVVSLPRNEISTELLVALMSGTEQVATGHDAPREISTRPAVDGQHEDERVGQTALRCTALQLARRADVFDLAISRGELFGIAGLDGQGAAELTQVLAGLTPPSGGTVSMAAAAGSGIMLPLTTYRHAMRSGMAYVPGKRQEEGLFGPLDIGDNIVMSSLRSISRCGVIQASRRRAVLGKYLNLLKIVPQDTRVPVETLSGGNAQKVLVARWLAREPTVLVLNDPLRGVDIQTKREFYSLLQGLRDSGTCIVMFSTEIAELLHVADRIGVVANFSVTTVLDAATTSEAEILAHMFSISDRHQPA